MYWCSRRIKFQKGKQRELLYRVREEFGTLEKLRLFLQIHGIQVSYITLKTWAQEVYSLPAEVVNLLVKVGRLDKEFIKKWKLEEYELNRLVGLSGASKQSLTTIEKLVLKQNREWILPDVDVKLHYNYGRPMRNFDFAYFHKLKLVALEEVGSTNMVNSRKASFMATMEIYYKDREKPKNIPLVFTVDERRKDSRYERHVAYDSLLHLLDNRIPVIMMERRVEILKATRFFRKMGEYPLEETRRYIVKKINDNKEKSVASAKAELKSPRTVHEKRVDEILSKYVETEGKKLILNRYGLPFIADSSFKLNGIMYYIFVDTDPRRCLASCFAFQETVSEKDVKSIGIYLQQKKMMYYGARKIADNYLITQVDNVPALIQNLMITT